MKHLQQNYFNKMNKLKINLILTFIILTSITLPMATIGQSHNEKVTIVGSFQPNLRESVKINLNPEEKKNEFEVGEVNFSNLQKIILLKNEAPLIAASTVRTDEKKSNFRNYLKAGFGSNLSPLFRFQHHSALSKNTLLNLGLKHHSSWVNVRDFAPSTWMKNKLDIGIQHAFNDYILNTEADYSYDQMYYYGFKPSDFPDTIINKDALLQHYQRLNVQAQLSSNYNNVNYLHHSFGVKYSYFSDKYSQYEHQVAVNGQLQKYYDWFNYDGTQLTGLDFGTSFVSGGDSLINRQTIWLNARPYLTLTGSFYELRAGLALSVAVDNNSEVFVHPELAGKLYIFNNQVELYAAFGGKSEEHTTNSLTFENPFLKTGNHHFFSNTKKLFQTGIKTSAIPRLDLHLGFSYQETDNGAFVVTDTNSLFNNYLAFIFNDYQRLGFVVEASYHFNDQWRSRLEVQFNQYETKTLAKAWHKPEFEAQWTVNYNFNPQWNFETEVFVSGERFAQGNKSSLFKPIRLKPIADINVAANYRITEQFSIFAQCNNVINNRYERFYNYPVQGFQILAGIKLLF